MSAVYDQSKVLVFTGGSLPVGGATLAEIEAANSFTLAGVAQLSSAAAAAAASVGAAIFPSTAAGVAATALNGYFYVINAAGGFNVWRNVAGVAVFQATIGDAAVATAAKDAAIAAAVTIPLSVASFANLAAVTPAQLIVGAVAADLATGARYQRVTSNQDLTYPGGTDLRALTAAGVFTFEQFGVVPDWNDGAQTGTDNVEALTAIFARMNAIGGRWLWPNGSFMTSGNHVITRSGVQMVGYGGATGRSSMICGALSGTALTVAARSPQFSGLRIGATMARRNMGNPLAAGGITNGHGIVFGIDGVLATMSRPYMNDILVSDQPTDSWIIATSCEMGGFTRCTVQNGVRHGLVMADGAWLGFVNLGEPSFHAEFDHFRALECGGHALHAPILARGTQAIKFHNFQALGCLWKRENDLSGSLRQVNANGINGAIYTHADLEDQQFAQTATLADSRSRTANAGPAAGAQVGSRSYMLNPTMSSLVDGILLGGPGCTVIQPRTYTGISGAAAMTTVVTSPGFIFGTTVELTSAFQVDILGNPRPYPISITDPTAKITIDGNNIIPTSSAAITIMQSQTATVLQIDTGNVTAPTNHICTIAERVRTPTGADILTTMQSKASATTLANLERLEITLRANAADVITIVDGGAASGNNAGFALGGGNIVLAGSKAVVVRYGVANNVWRLVRVIADFERELAIVEGLLPLVGSSRPAVVAAETGTADGLTRISMGATRAFADGAIITLRARSGDTITAINGTAASGDNMGMDLGGANRVLTGGATLVLQYVHSLGKLVMVGFYS